MAELTEVVVHRGGVVGYGLKYLDLEVEKVDTNDTVVVAELNAITDTIALRMDTGAAVTCSESGNTITITEAGLTDVPIAIKVSGT